MVSSGMAVPEKILTNSDLQKIVETSDEWIKARTGMSERHVSDEKTAASDLALRAAQQALEAAGIQPEDLDACVLQNRLGAKKAMAFDLSAACTGFIYGLSICQAYIESGRYRNILLVGVDLLTKVVDWSDRNTCVLFGDGAGAVVIQPNGVTGVLDTVIGSDGSSAELLCQPYGGSRHPLTEEAVREKKYCITMNGREIFKQAVRVMTQTAQDVLLRCGRRLDEVSLVIPHQANIRIIESVADRLGVSMDRFYINVGKYANTSAATIPIALHEARADGRLQPGDLVLMVSFGGGLTWGASLVQF